MTRTKALGAEPYLPAHRGPRTLPAAIEDCRGCDLHRDATQAVFGEGPRDARLVLIGEQPGDVEDQRGRPFTGLAGRLLDRALEQIGLDRKSVYLTNAVKHFRFEHRGKRRIHQRPTLGQITACRPWLTAELAMIKPEGVVLLGSLAGQSLFGADYRVGDHRGQFIDLPDSPDLPDHAAWALATIHPSAALRAEDRAAVFAGFVDDLRLAAERLETSRRS